MAHPIRMTTDPATAEAANRPNSADLLVRRTTVVAALADLALMAAIGQLIPPLAVFAVLTLLVLVALRRRPAGLTMTLGALALVSNLGGLPFWTADVLHPADTVAFAWVVLSAGSRFVAMAGAVIASRRPETAERGARLTTSAAVGLLAIAVVTTVVARATAASTPAAAGDVAVAIEGFDFPDEPITVASGGSLHVANRDVARHTFSVDGTDLDTTILGGTAARVEVDLPPGTYDLVCLVPGHEAMAGTLEVE